MSVPQLSSTPVRQQTRQISSLSTALIAVAVFVFSFLLRFLFPEFPNDHFTFLARSRQILLGEIPGRDFIDTGHPLRIYLSAAVQMLWGYHLLGETVLTIFFLSFGAALTFLLAARASSSRLIGLVVTLLAVATYPRLYNYPKVFLYVLGLLVCWKYVDKRSLLNLLLMVLCTALAFLFRHDHGVAVAVAAVTTLVATHWAAPRLLFRQVVRYGLGLVLVLGPFFVFLAVNCGIPDYFGSAFDFVHAELARSRLRWPAFVWNLSPDAFVGEPALLRLKHLFDLFLSENAIPWLYYLLFCLPLLAFGKLVLLWIRGRAAEEFLLFVAPKILSTIALCTTVNAMLLRDALRDRLADVAAPAAVLGGWLVGEWMGWRPPKVAVRELALPAAQEMPRRRRRVRYWLPALVRFGIILVVFTITAASIVEMAAVKNRLAQTALFAGPQATVHRLAKVMQRLRTSPPINAWAPPGSVGFEGLVRYIYECTTPTDRVFVTWFAPDVYFYSERAFAGGLPFVIPGYWSSPEQQLRTLARLQGQSVPIILVQGGQEDLSFQSSFPLIQDYFMTNYQVVQESSFGGDPSVVYKVLVDRRRLPSGMYEPLALPCFR